MLLYEITKNGVDITEFDFDFILQLLLKYDLI